MSDSVRDRIYELADEFGVHPSIVRSLYDIMPNELYDGIVTALEDICDGEFGSPEAMSDPENTWRKNGSAPVRV